MLAVRIGRKGRKIMATAMKRTGQPAARSDQAAVAFLDRDAAGQLILVLAAAVRIACRRMTALHLKAMHDSVEQAWRTPAAFGWDRKAAAHAEIFNLLADAASDPLAPALTPALSAGAGLAYDLMIEAGHAADGMITSSRQRLLTHLRAGDADAAEQEIESHLRVLHYMSRLARPLARPRRRQHTRHTNLRQPQNPTRQPPSFR
jgi:DNA-binding FadR family transcriptional regulator